MAPRRADSPTAHAISYAAPGATRWRRPVLGAGLTVLGAAVGLTGLAIVTPSVIGIGYVLLAGEVSRIFHAEPGVLVLIGVNVAVGTLAIVAAFILLRAGRQFYTGR